MFREFLISGAFYLKCEIHFCDFFKFEKKNIKKNEIENQPGIFVRNNPSVEVLGQMCIETWNKHDH